VGQVAELKVHLNLFAELCIVIMTSDNLASSANIKIRLNTTDGKSLIKKINNDGPKTGDPCRTPLITRVV